MSKLRLVFVKEHQASYISHLDVMRTFQRVFPRAGLSIKHSNGFHPHPILSIVLPLPVGQSSDCEILDFESVEDSTGEGVAEALADAGFDPVYGARPLRRQLREQIEDPLAELMLTGAVHKGDTVAVRLQADRVVCEKASCLPTA